MPTYAIHHFSAIVKDPIKAPKNARRIAMRARRASVNDRRQLRVAA